MHLVSYCQRSRQSLVSREIEEVPLVKRDRDERVQIMLSQQELAALDDFRFKHRMPSRAAALREVMRRGLGVQGSVEIGGAQSADFGVLKQTRRNSSAKR